MTQFTRTKINQALASGGRPQHDNKVAGLVLALRRADLNDEQAMVLGCLISDLRAGYDWHLDSTAQCLRTVTRRRHAEKHPNGKWAVLYRRYGHRASYMRDAEPDAMNWSQPMLDSSYGRPDASYPFA